MVEILKSVGKSLISALLTEKFIKEVIVFLLDKLAKKTDNEIDDKVVDMVKKALSPEKK